MRIENQINELIKRLKIFHLIIFIIVNSLIFFGGYAYFKNSPKQTEGLTTLNILIPRYSSIGAGITNYLTILNSSRLFSEFDFISQDERYNTRCQLTSSNYDDHVFYFSQEKYVASFERFIPISIKIQHTDKNLVKNCSEVFVEISEEQFSMQKKKLIENLKRRLIIETERRKLKNEAVYKILEEIKNATKEYNQSDSQEYLFDTYLDYIKASYMDQGKINMEKDLEANSQLKIEYSITKTIVEIPNNYLTKIMILNLVVSLILVFFYLYYYTKQQE